MGKRLYNILNLILCVTGILVFTFLACTFKNILLVMPSLIFILLLKYNVSDNVKRDEYQALKEIFSDSGITYHVTEYTNNNKKYFAIVVPISSYVGYKYRLIFAFSEDDPNTFYKIFIEEFE